MTKQVKLFLILIIGVVGLGLLFVSGDFSKWLTTSVVRETELDRKVVITIPENAPPGEHTFSINVEDDQFGDLLAQSEPVTINVLAGTETGVDGEDGSGGSGGGSGGGDSGGSGGEEKATVVKTYAFAPERGHETVSKNTTVVEDQGRVVARLAGNTSVVKKVVRVPRENYWLYVTARHDKPAPVDVAIYVDDQAWKVLSLDQGDDKYRLHQIGLLRNFGGGEISFKLINDTYDRIDVGNEAKDRNFFFDAWALSTDASLDRIRAPGGGVIKGVKTTGVKLLPGLNQVIREELGPQFVTWDIWSYYAPRLVAKPDRREAIGTEDRLRTVMRFWKIARPWRPRGE